ncbi:type II secretion system F family protein [Aerococcaceae bacterium DSM 111020]|nr:type II secretion system F family protein [Aerococcaceae bacterium DSM 111020]
MNWSEWINTVVLRKNNRRLSQKDRVYFLKLLSELLTEGFSLNQCIDFMCLLMPKQQASFQYIIEQMLIGLPFETTLQELGFSLSTVAQLFYGQRQGKFVDSLSIVSEHLETKMAYQQKIIKTLIYPIVMTIALFILLFGMRAYLLPHVTSFITEDIYQNQAPVRWLVTFFTFLPQIVGVLFGSLLILYLIFDFYILRLPLLRRFHFYKKIPFIRYWTTYYCTYKVAKQFGNFLSSGYSMLQIVDTLEHYPIDPFLTAISAVLRNALNSGIPLPDIMKDSGLFTDIFPLIIQQGELTSQMAQKCLVYSDKLFEDLLDDISKKITYIQPILFIIIAALVMTMYLLMMLPMLTMEGI